MLNTLTFIVFLLLALPGHSCPHAEDSCSFPSKDALEIARSSNKRRVTWQVSSSAKTTITNVRVFDGEKLLPLSTVFIEGGMIVLYAHEATVVDGNGGWRAAMGIPFLFLSPPVHQSRRAITAAASHPPAAASHPPAAASHPAATASHPAAAASRPAAAASRPTAVAPCRTPGSHPHCFPPAATGMVLASGTSAERGGGAGRGGAGCGGTGYMGNGWHTLYRGWAQC
ncbi:hypothetical protein C8J57DRAFT_1224743 [Mycena rebaudengoi]|nr:hypothetical protein C8J57DRAFT_1224743 [Mycena rebaudengoi]